MITINRVIYIHPYQWILVRCRQLAVGQREDWWTDDKLLMEVYWCFSSPLRKTGGWENIWDGCLLFQVHGACWKSCWYNHRGSALTSCLFFSSCDGDFCICCRVRLRYHWFDPETVCSSCRVSGQTFVGMRLDIKRTGCHRKLCTSQNSNNFLEKDKKRKNVNIHAWWIVWQKGLA